MSKRIAVCLPTMLFSSLVFGQSWGNWQAETTLPTNGVAKTHAIGLELDGTIFLLGGPPWMNPGDMEDGTVYSMPMGGNTWIEEIGFDGYGEVLGQGGGVDNLGRIIIFGGDRPNNPGFNRPPFEWNPLEGPWHQHAARSPLAPATNFAYCTDDLNRIYSIGGGLGKNASGLNMNSTYAERFIGSTDIWEPIAPLPIATANAAASPDGLGHILVFGGINADGTSRMTTVQQYDIATNTWSTNTNEQMPVALSHHRATLGADGRIYILGGVSGSIGSGITEQSVHIYDPAMNQWFVGPDMSVPRSSFASFLGSDDRIYILGGENDTGGTSTVESVYTTPCPIFVQSPLSDLTLWQNTTINLSATVIGGGTITYQWKHNGVDLVDGTSEGGGEISGATTDTLSITSSGPLDAGAYTLVATNLCGSVSSLASSVTIRVPPEIPTQWTWTSLHPAYADRSFASGVDNGIQVGNAIFDTPEYNNIDHPTVWHGTALSATNLTPASSQGGNIADFAGDKMVGWWWAPIQCYVNHQWQTCYFRRGAWWELDGTFHETNYSGFEYTSMNATDGVTIVGTGSTDDDSGNVYNKAVIWQGNNYEFAQSIHPAGIPDSFCYAVDGEYQYGSIGLPFAGVHAAKWSGSSTTFVDMHPDGYINSTISDASDGQQVGVVNLWNNPHAVIWANTPNSLVDLNPDGATQSNASACEMGIQIGTVLLDGETSFRPAIWAGSKDTFYDLSSVIPDGYTGLSMAALDVATDGTISIVGNAWNVDQARNEAILITSTTAAACQADMNGDGQLNFFDVSAFLSAFGALDPSADITGDGQFNFFDVSGFLSAFNAGCP